MDIQEYKWQGGKVFLYAPKYPNSERATERIIREWQKKTFGVTNITLVFYLEQTIDWYRYPIRWRHQCLASCAPIIHIIKRYHRFDDWLEKADFYIVDNLEENLDDINVVVNGGGTVLSAVSEDEIFPMLKYSEEQINTLNRCQTIINNALFSKFSPCDYEYMLFHNGLGETVSFYYSIAEYKAKNNKPIVVLCFDETRKSLLEESPYIDVVAHVPFPLYEYVAVFLAEQYHMKNFMEIFYTPDIVALMADADCEVLYMQVVRIYLGLLPHEPVQKYETPVSEEKRKVGREVFRQWNLREGRTVWLCMDGISNGSLYESDFFKKLVVAIREADYDVIIKSDKSVIEGVPFAQLYPWETTELVSLCGNIICIPTGIICVVKAMNMDRPLNVQKLYIENMFECNSHMAQFMHKLPLIRKFGSKYLDHAHEFEEGFNGDNIQETVIPIYKDTDMDALIPQLVEGLA